MAQNKIYKPYDAFEVKKGETFTSANIPTGVNVLELLLGVRILDENNNPTPLRGARVKITPTGIPAAASPKPSIPFIWLEREIIVIDSAFSYEFLDTARIGYGIEEAI